MKLPDLDDHGMKRRFRMKFRARALLFGLYRRTPDRVCGREEEMKYACGLTNCARAMIGVVSIFGVHTHLYLSTTTTQDTNILLLVTKDHIHKYVNPLDRSMH